MASKTYLSRVSRNIIAGMIMLSATPYTRPVVRPELPQPWTPSGYLLLRRAFDRFGKTEFGDEWTGEELRVRKCVFGPPKPPVEPENNGLIDKFRSSRGETKTMDRPVRYVVNGFLQNIPYEQALARYYKEKDELLALWQEETAAFQRYCASCGRFRQVLYSLMVPSFVLTNNGHMEPMDAQIWATEKSAKIFETGRAETSVLSGDELYKYEGMVLVPETALMQFLNQPAPQDASDSPQPHENAPEMEAAPDETKGLSRRGRLAKWEWEDCFVEICRIVHLDGLPKSQAEMVRKLQDWFISQVDNHPAESEIKKRVSKVFRAIREAENSEDS